MEDPVAIVIAHPDDETLGAAAAMPLFRDLLIVQVTDGAPPNLADAKAAGFATAADYAAARQRELDAALAAGKVQAARTILGAPDQAASLEMPALTQALVAPLAQHGTRAILTHAYEGGHPDHDAVAFIARHAADATGAALIEMPLYHAAPEGWAVARFLPGPDPTVLQLTEAERARKRAMLAAFATQAATLSQFPFEREAYRPAPPHDFASPPHDGTLLYERYDWGMTGPRWRALAAEATCALRR